MLYQHRKPTNARQLTDRIWHRIVFVVSEFRRWRINHRSLDHLDPSQLKDLGLQRGFRGDYKPLDF